MTEAVEPVATPDQVEDLASSRDVFIARQPIFDEETRCTAYELPFRNGLDNICPPGDPNDAASQTLEAAWLSFGLDTLVGPHTAFVNFTRDLLLSGYGTTLPAQSTVIELLETIDGDPEVVEACRDLKRKGYAIALDDFVYRPALDPLIPLADIIKIDFRNANAAEQLEHARRLGNEVVLLAEKVETLEEYRQAVALGFARFQGFFFCRPEVIGERVLSGTRLTYLKLLQAVTRPEMQIDEVDSVIRADAGMTHRLLKYLGSAALGFRTEITSVQHGLALLGREQTRRFVSLVALGEMGNEKPPELLVTSAVRGKFCELVGDDVTMADRKAELFLVGLLSLMDAMLDQPMPKVLEQLPLSDDLTKALVGEKSPLRPVLAFVEHHERGEWEAAAELAAAHGIVEAHVREHYQEAVAWATQSLKG